MSSSKSGSLWVLTWGSIGTPPVFGQEHDRGKSRRRSAATTQLLRPMHYLMLNPRTPNFVASSLLVLFIHGAGLGVAHSQLMRAGLFHSVLL